MFRLMPAHNPYAPSKASLTSNEPATASGGLWCDDADLIVASGARFPHRCVKCNEPSEQPQKLRKIYWHHPAVYLLLLGYAILYIIVAVIVRRKAEIDPGLCAEHLEKRRLWIGIGCVGALSAWIPLVILANKLDVDPGITMLLALACLIGFAVAGIVKSRILYANRIDDHKARLKGADERFLASLPKYAGG